MEENSFIAGLRHFFDSNPGIKPATISARIGDKSTIRKMLDGTTKTPTLANAIRIADALGTTVEAIIDRTANLQRQRVAVAGRVGAGAHVPLVDATVSGDGLFQIEVPAQLTRNGTPKGVAAVEVEGDSMTPMYQPGDILFFIRHTHNGIPDEDIGRPCIVEDSDGMAWVKQVKRGTEPGLFHLISLNPNAETKHNVEIKWAARVMLALPAEMVERS